MGKNPQSYYRLGTTIEIMLTTVSDSLGIIYKNDDDEIRCCVKEEEISSQSFSEVFNKAVELLPKSGGEIEIRPGTYLVDSTLEIDSPLRLYGVGAGNTSTVDDMTILKGSSVLDGPVIEVTGGKAPSNTMHGSGMFDMGIVGNKGGDQTDCLLLNESDSVMLSNMFFERLLLDNANRDGMNIQNATKHIQLRDLWIGHCERDALTIQDGYRYWITNGYFYDSRNGIRIEEAASDVSIVFAHCRKNQRAGMKIESDRYQVLGGRVVGNHYGVESYGDYGIILAGEYLNNSVGIILGDGSLGPQGSQIFMNRIGVGLRGKHRTQEILNDETDNKLKRFIEISDEYGLSEATKRSAEYALSQSKELLSSKDSGSHEKSDKENIGIKVTEAAKDSDIANNSFFRIEDEIYDDGERTLIENTAKIEGVPNKSEEWSQRAKDGTVVCDEQNSDLYIFVRNKWRSF